MQVQPDIIAVTETWLEPSGIKTVTLPGYNFFHTDAVTASPNGTGLAGGISMYIKASMNATVRDQFRLELPGCEDLSIELPLKNGKQCYISVIYKHPKTNILDFQNHLSKSIEKLNKTNRKFYICGDMNIDFLQVQSNPMIKQYYDYIYSLGCLSVIHSPTRITASSCTLIHHIYTNDVEQDKKCSIILFEVSGHLPLHLVINCPVKYNNKRLSYTYRSMKIFLPEQFLENLHVQYRDKRVTETESINDAFKAFVDVLRHTLNKHARIKKVTHKILKLRTKLWFTKGILIFIKVKNELFACTKKNPSNEFLYQHYKKYRSKLTLIIELSKKNAL